MATVKVSWSGGKDSTCAVFKHLERGDIVKAVCYIPMFTDEIPLIRKKHYEFILSAAERIRKSGGEVHFAKGITFAQHFYHIKTKGINEGKIMGFPCIKVGACDFKNYSKIKAIKSVDVGYFDYQDIGIAFDEIARHSQLTTQLRSILYETGITEKDAFRWCYDNDLLSPLYEEESRDGCCLCPQAPKRVFYKWIAEYPEAIPIVLKMQEDLKLAYPNRAPRRNGEWWINTEQITFFD